MGTMQAGDEWWERNSSEREKALARKIQGAVLTAHERKVLTCDDAGWEYPVPLGDGEPLPEFPVHALPEWARDFVSAVAVSTQTPVDLPGTMVLGALAAAAGGRAVAQPRAGWSEPLNLYLATAMEPGNRKSAVVEQVTRPLRVAERVEIDKMSTVVSEAKTRQSVAVTKAKELTRQAAQAAARDADDAPDLIAKATDATAMAELIAVPTIPRLLADDCTPEALSSLMAEQSGRLAVISAEGGVFDIIAGKYSKMPTFDVYLKAHAGDEIRVDRVGRKPEHIARPALTLALAVQPAVLRAISEREGFRGRGLLARFMFVLPTSFVGSREIGADPVSDDVRARYEDMLQALVGSLAEWTDPALLMFSPAANAALKDYERALEPRLGPGGDLHHLADWGSKLAGAVVRFAGLLHLASRLKTGYRDEIGVGTFDCAALIGDYFLAHAIRAHAFMGADPMFEDAIAILNWASGRNTLTKREAHRALQARFPKSADLDGPLALLEDRGWLRRQPPPPVGPEGGRPPSPTFEVHPHARQN